MQLYFVKKIEISQASTGLALVVVVLLIILVVLIEVVIVEGNTDIAQREMDAGRSVVKMVHAVFPAWKNPAHAGSLLSAFA